MRKEGERKGEGRGVEGTGGEEERLVIPMRFAFFCYANELHSHSEIFLIKPLYDVPKEN